MQYIASSESRSPRDSRFSLEVSLKQWQFHQHQGYQYHQKSQYQKAVISFRTSQDIAWKLVMADDKACSQDCWDMLFNASHHLAASYNSMGHNKQATDLLHHLHQHLLLVIADTFRQRAQRLCALAILDNTLFSLTSQLAYENRVTEIHKAIATTEALAEEFADQFLSA